MRKLIRIPLFITICLIYACEDHDKTLPEFYVLNTELTTGQQPKGFSYKELNIITFPNSDNIIPEFILSCHTNETGDIIGPMLSHPNLENRFILLKSYDNLSSALNHYDTLSTRSINSYQSFALDIKPFDIWQIKTNSGETGILLVLETRTENKNNAPFAEIKFKAKKIIQ